MEIIKKIFSPPDDCMSELSSRIGLILYIICIITTIVLIIIKIPYIAKNLLKLSTLFSILTMFIFKILYYSKYCGNIIEVVLTVPFNVIITFGTPMLVLYAEMGPEFIIFLDKLNKKFKKIQEKLKNLTDKI